MGEAVDAADVGPVLACADVVATPHQREGGERGDSEVVARPAVALRVDVFVLGDLVRVQPVFVDVLRVPLAREPVALRFLVKG